MQQGNITLTSADIEARMRKMAREQGKQGRWLDRATIDKIFARYQ